MLHFTAVKGKQNFRRGTRQAALKLLATRVHPQDHKRFDEIARAHNRNITGHLKTLVEQEIAAHEKEAA